MAAVLTQEPAFIISDDKAGLLAKRLVDVSKHYNIGVDGPVMSVINLAIAAGMINLPIMMTLARKRAASRPKRATPNEPTFDGVDVTPRGGVDYSGMSDFTA